MKTAKPISRRLIRLTLCALLLAVTLAPFTRAQSGGTLTIKSAVGPGGGGTSANGSTRVDASIGQNMVGTSSDVGFTLNAGFWPNATPCPFVLSPRAYAFPTAGGAGSVTVTASGDCNWVAAASENWVNIVSGASGRGSGTVEISVKENATGTPRQAKLVIGDYTNLIVQSSVPDEDCQYSTDSLLASFPPIGGAGSISVRAAERCGWQAASSESWVVVTSGLASIGNGVVTYSVAANTSGMARSATIKVAGQSFIVKQDN